MTETMVYKTKTFIINKKKEFKKKKKKQQMQTHTI